MANRTLENIRKVTKLEDFLKTIEDINDGKYLYIFLTMKVSLSTSANSPFKTEALEKREKVYFLVNIFIRKFFSWPSCNFSECIA